MGLVPRMKTVCSNAKVWLGAQIDWHQYGDNNAENSSENNDDQHDNEHVNPDMWLKYLFRAAFFHIFSYILIYSPI